ncbi:MAG: T9SS type A sorting domain-containing protein [bacterium]|nr:MAG: T9SS type A sorting domain-containing protein [bacterium]
MNGRYLEPESDLIVLDITDPTTPAFISVLDTEGSLGYCDVSGDYLYTSEWVGGEYRLLVVDISDPANPTVLDTYEANATWFTFTPFGEYGFICAGDLGVQVVRIAEPVLPPELASSYTSTYLPWGITISGDYAYLANQPGSSDLQVLDISDPTNPILAGSCNTPDGSFEIAVSGDHAYVAGRLTGLLVMDISDPTSPMHIATYNTSGYAVGLAVSGNYAYVADYGSGLLVFDVSNPATPTLVDDYNTPHLARNVRISGDCAYLADGQTGMMVFDISDPTNIVHIGTCDTPYEAYDLTIEGDYAYIGDLESGLQVIDISNPTTPIIIGSCDTPGRVRGVTVEGDFAYAADRGSGLQVIDITDPTNPILVGNYDTPGHARVVAITGDYAYVADVEGGVHIFHVFQRRFNTTSNTGRSLAVNELKRDIAEVQLTTTEVGTIVWSVSADNGAHWEPIVPGAGWHSVIHPGSELMWKSQHVYDLEQPGINPTCSFIEMEWIYSSVEVGFDIKPGSCPNPFNVKNDPNEDDKGEGPNKEYAKPRKGGVLPAAIVGSDELDVNEIDISTILLEGIAPIRSNYEDVTRPVENGGECACTDEGPDGYLDLTLKFRRMELAEVLGSVGHGEVVELTITGSLLDGTAFEGTDCVTIVGKRSSGPKFEKIEVVELWPPVPNPSNPMTRISYSVPDACVVSMEIYDISGRLIIRLLDNITVTGGKHTVEWRGVDKYGRAVGSGVYLYRLIAGNEIITRKMVLLR